MYLVVMMMVVMVMMVVMMMVMVETPQGNTQVSLKTQTCERKSSSRARDSA